MLYQRPTFTCPAAAPRTSQQTWDFAMLSKSEFTRKYQITSAEYEQLQRG